jgi:ArsR family transcriptional regulator
MPDQDFIVVPDPATVAVALEPAHNAIYSLLLLAKCEPLSGLGEWVTRTAAALTPEEEQRHRLVTVGFHYAILPQRSWPNFPTYLDHLAAVDPLALRDKLMTAYARLSLVDEKKSQGKDDEPLPVDLEAAFVDADAYLRFLRERFGPSHVDADLERQAYAYVIDPPAMQELIVSHLRAMWSKYLSPEWERIQPMLQDAVDAFHQVDLAGMSKLEAAELVAGRALDDTKCCGQVLEQAERIVCVPSAHIGPYLATFHASGTLWILFGARLPEGVQFHAPDLSRAEILVRLNALTDDSRLRILKLVSDSGEQRSQDIISRLGLSQSTVSRHLKQLSAAGYLSERRCNGAKCYQLNSERIEDTLRAVSAFLLGS